MTDGVYIETERLVIRRFCFDDLNDLFEILGDRETMQCLEPPYDKDAAKKFLLDFCIARKGALAVALPKSGKMIGYLLFNRCGSADVYEMGWIFNKELWRKGYAFEACSAVIRYAFSELGAHKVFAETVDAVKSVPLMKKLGMKREGLQRKHVLGTDGEWKDVYLYGVLREDARLVDQIR